MEKIGKYKILEILGKGGMGIVYKAQDPDIDRVVAIKTIRFDLVQEGTLRDELMGRFMREARAAGKLSHSNIVTIYDVGREEDLTYIVMQFIKGQSLEGLICSQKKLTPREIFELLEPICSALDYAHKRGIVHRDIKPANIILDESGKPFILDFGVARIETSTITQTGSVVGTPSYMSPEQIMGKTVDSRSDVFSLGVILYELLTGQRPFVGENISTIVYKIVNEDPPHLHDIKKDIPEEYEQVIERALAKKPEHRSQTCTEMIQNFKDPSGAAGQTIVMDTAEEALGAYGRKKKRGWVFALVFMALLILGGGGYWYFVLKPQQASASSPEPQTVAAQEQATSALPGMSEPTPRNPTEEKLSQIKERFESEDFEGTVKLAEEILAVDPENSDAQDYLGRAKAKLLEVEIAPILQSGIESYNRGKHAECVQTMERILKLDANHKEAQQYLYLADTTLSKKDVLGLVEQHRQAEERKDLLAILNHVGSAALSNQLQGEYKLLFNGYDDIQSVVSNTSVQFSSRWNATVKFSHLLAAVYKRDGKKKVVFEGLKNWSLRKQGGTWKITKMQ